MTHILKVSCGGKVFAKEFEEKVVIVFFLERKGRAQEGLRKKRGGRGREGTTNYMTHILKISCGGQVFAKEFKEKVVIAFL